MLPSMQHPHWMIVAGGILVVIGFIGFALHQNRNGETVDERIHEEDTAAKGK